MLLRKFEPPFEPLRDDIVCRNHGERVAHIVTRDAFAEVFSDWKDADEVRLRWWHRLGFDESVPILAQALDQLAQAAGYPDRSSLNEAFVDAKTLTLAVELNRPTRKRLLDAWRAVSKVWVPYNQQMDKLVSSDRRGLLDEAQVFVCSTGLPWPWLAIELVQDFGFTCLSIPLGLAVKKQPILSPPRELISEPVELKVLVESGQEVDSALRQLRSMYEDAKRSVESQRAPRGRVPKKLRSTYRRDAEWFFRHDVLGESYRSIAKSEFSAYPRPEDRRKDVADAVNRARKHLEMAAFRYRLGDDGTYTHSPLGEFERLPSP